MKIPREAQRGAALIVGLVLLMVLTVLAISAMRTATLDLTMAGNTQYRENAFQLAESGVQATLRNVETDVIDITTVPNCPTTAQPWSAADLAWDGAVAVPALRGRYETRLCYEGEGYVEGSSVPARHYRVEARGRTDQRNAEAIHAQGFYRDAEE